MLEQEIIARYFSRHSADAHVELGVGDDGAVVRPPDNSKLVITVDTLNEGTHFHANCSPEHLGHKALAVNLSDLAAMGATPLWATLSLSLPEIEHSWLEGFSRGLYSLADRYGVKLVGGDLVRGARSISIQATGYLASGQALTRSQAGPDDLIYATGTLGDAAVGLKLLKEAEKHAVYEKDRDSFLLQLNRPQPRVEVGREIAAFASAAIDLSDGLFLNLEQLLQMSGVGARVALEQLPLSDAMQRWQQADADWDLVLSGGEDYELVFTASPQYGEEVSNVSTRTGCPITEIGCITRGGELELLQAGHRYSPPDSAGFDHFG